MNVIRRVPVILCSSVLVMICAGCTSHPDLAGRNMTPYQRAWSRIIRESYPRWRPPAFPPVVAPDRHEVLPPAVPVAPAPASYQDAEIVPYQSSAAGAKSR